MRCLIGRHPSGERGALLSDCGTYRYRLWREWDESRPMLAFVMLNPSTADHLVDDPTITRCMAHAVANHFGRLEVANLFPLRATHPGALLSHRDPLGPVERANWAILEAVDGASMVICAWGSHSATAMRATEVLHLLRITAACSKLFHLGLNRNGNPRHPLYISTRTRPQPFVARHDV